MMAFFRRKECFSNDDVLQLQIAFDKFDVSGSGSLTCYSLLCLMRQCSLEVVAPWTSAA